MAGAKQSIPVARMKSSATSSDWIVAGGIRADAVLDALDPLDLAFDGGAVPPRLGHDLDALPAVLLDGELGGIEEHRVPAHGQARR